MADQPPKKAKPSGVSPVRKIVSGILLVGALAVAGVELRASLGQRQSTAALKAKSDDPVAVMTHEEAKALLSMAPAEDLVNENDTYSEYKYSWFSLLRPKQMQLFMIVEKSTPPKFITSATEPETALMSSPADGDGQEMAPPLGTGGFGPPAGGPGAGASRPPADDTDEAASEDQPTADEPADSAAPDNGA